MGRQFSKDLNIDQQKDPVKWRNYAKGIGGAGGGILTALIAVNRFNYLLPNFFSTKFFRYKLRKRMLRSLIPLEFEGYPKKDIGYIPRPQNTHLESIESCFKRGSEDKFIYLQQESSWGKTFYLRNMMANSEIPVLYINMRGCSVETNPPINSFKRLIGIPENQSSIDIEQVFHSVIEKEFLYFSKAQRSILGMCEITKLWGGSLTPLNIIEKGKPVVVMEDFMPPQANDPMDVQIKTLLYLFLRLKEQFNCCNIILVSSKDPAPLKGVPGMKSGKLHHIKLDPISRETFLSHYLKKLDFEDYEIEYMLDCFGPWMNYHELFFTKLKQLKERCKTEKMQNFKEIEYEMNEILGDETLYDWENIDINDKLFLAKIVVEEMIDYRYNISKDVYFNEISDDMKPYILKILKDIVEKGSFTTFEYDLSELSKLKEHSEAANIKELLKSELSDKFGRIHVLKYQNGKINPGSNKQKLVVEKLLKNLDENEKNQL